MLVLDTLLLLGDTTLAYGSVVWNSIDILGSARVVYGDGGIHLSPLGDSSRVILRRFLPPSSGRASSVRFADSVESSLIFGGSVLLGVGVSRTFSQRSGLVINVGGRMGDATVEGIFRAQNFDQTYYLSDFEESYLRLKRRGMYMEAGTFYEGRYRIFGMRGGYGNFRGMFGYERAIMRRREIVYRGTSIIPFASTGEEVVYGSVKLLINGRVVREGWHVDYDSRTLYLEPGMDVHPGDVLTVEYQYLSEGVRRDFVSVSLGPVSYFRRVENIRFSSDSLKGATAPGYYPSYYMDTVRGSYVLEDSIFRYVGEGRGRYVVYFSPFASGDYEYDPQGDYYYFVGRGRGHYMPLRYMNPPSRQQYISLNLDSVRILVAEYNPNYYLYRAGRVDVEGRVSRRWGGFRLFVIRKRSDLIEMSMPPNPAGAVEGTFATLTYNGIGVFLMDSLYGAYLKGAGAVLMVYRGGWMLDGSWRGPFYSLSLRSIRFSDSLRSFIHMEVGGEIYALVKVFFGEDSLDYRAGFGIRLSGAKGSFLYDPVRGSGEGVLDVSYGGLSSSLVFTKAPSIAYVDRYVYVGEGLGDYSYDAVSGTYYRDAGGSYVRVAVPLSSDTSGYLLRGNLNYYRGNFRMEASVDRYYRSLSVGYGDVELFYRWFQNSEYASFSGDLAPLFLGMDYRTEIGMKVWALAGSERMAVGGGYYMRGAPFLMARYDGPVSLTLEYRFSDVPPHLSKGMDILSNFSISRRMGNFLFRASGILNYRNGIVYKNLSLGVSRQF